VVAVELGEAVMLVGTEEVIGIHRSVQAVVMMSSLIEKRRRRKRVTLMMNRDRNHRMSRS
jgi:hypothetical protein